MAQLDGTAAAGEAEGASRFNALAEDEARALLRHCLEAGSWVETVLAGRPYATTGELLAAAGTAAARMDDRALESALAGHPRIGERPTGGGTSAAFSRAEQSGVDPADAQVATRLREGNHAYEERFGHVFLIRAAGRSAPEVLAALEQRMTNDEHTERQVVKEQLGQIAALRLGRQLTGPTTGPPAGGAQKSTWR